MAEKKFFVDINLQGSALTNAKIGTNTGIGSTEGAFGYDSSAHRLQYFDGTATKEVANLSDIAAVTGGLIFQGGYDPTTNTPDITDGTALKGFFWAATAAGTFLGESVQVGDSIVAKVDNAGTDAADWLILQGNVVIATDSVDGISRLATQTEANDGTEGGAVVITPATLQGKIDAQITPEINNKLPLAGGTMSGNINMDSHAIENITELNGANGDMVYLGTGALVGSGNLDLNGNTLTNVPTPIVGVDAANKTYVDDNTSNKLPLAGGTMSGAIDMGGYNLGNAENITAANMETNYIRVNNVPDNPFDATNKSYVDTGLATKLDLAGGTMTGAIDMGSNYIDGVSNINANIVNASFLDSNSADPIFVSSNLDFSTTDKIINLPAPTDGGDATNKTYVDGAASTAQANAEAYADSLAPNYDAAGAAATAESNANDYTDDAIAQEVTDRNAAIASKTYTQFISTSDWVLSDGLYSLDVIHGLQGFPVISAIESASGNYCEMQYKYLIDGTTKISSNILPSETIIVSFVNTLN